MFKIGDIVEITEESDATGMLDFKKGEGYTVCDYRVAQAGTHTAQVYVYTDSGKGGWYAASHFKLKEDLKLGGVAGFSIGDAVICIETDFYECDVNDITYLKEYVVKRSNRGCIQIVKDSGELGWFSSDKFKLKEDTIVEKKECLFKEGQVVWDLRNGRGVVEEIANDELYPVRVKFDLKDMDGGVITDYYMADGRYVKTQTIRSLYFSEPKIEAATEPVFEPTLKKGSVVIANDDEEYRIICLKAEEEGRLVDYNDRYYYKTDWEFYTLGEKINFK